MERNISDEEIKLKQYGIVLKTLVRAMNNSKDETKANLEKLVLSIVKGEQIKIN